MHAAPSRVNEAFLSPPQIARRLRVKPSKVIRWIRTGELTAVDVSQKRGGRPRWRIAVEEFERFLQARSSRKPTHAPRRRKRQLAITEFFH
jgi:excisionase family DNA binding protein